MTKKGWADGKEPKCKDLKDRDVRQLETFIQGTVLGDPVYKSLGAAQKSYQIGGEEGIMRILELLSQRQGRTIAKENRRRLMGFSKIRKPRWEKGTAGEISPRNEGGHGSREDHFDSQGVLEEPNGPRGDGTTKGEAARMCIKNEDMDEKGGGGCSISRFQGDRNRNRRKAGGRRYDKGGRKGGGPHFDKKLGTKKGK